MNQRTQEPFKDSAQQDVIEPIKFKPASNRPEIPRLKLPWAHVLIAMVVLVGVWGAWYVVTARSVSIVTEPAEATVAVDEFISPNIGGQWMLRPGARMLVVESPGYHSYRGEVDITAVQLQSHTIKLKPLPGQLRIAVTPVSSAIVTVDDKHKTNAPGVIENIEAGAHEVSVRAERYLPFTTTVEIEGRGVEQQLAVDLKPAWADISINSQPSGASVEVDDNALGETPLASEILQGERQLTISLNGYKTWQRTLKVVAGTPIELPPVLLAKADGHLEVTSVPVGASITVNGEFKGRSPIKLAVVPDKPHKITALKDGYGTNAKTVTVASGITKPVNIRLQAELAAVQIIATPDDAELMVDGKSLGNANQTIKLPTHAHEIEIRKSGFVSYSATVTPRKGIRKRIKVRLKKPGETSASAPINKAEPTKTKGIISSSVGQQLKLFRGGTIMMGSSRRDPARRANEVLHEATLARPFYLGIKEVNNREFRRFLANHRAQPIKGIDVGGDNYPVISVSWESAALFCNWLSRQDSLDVFYQIKNGKVLGVNPAALGYRLPTEAEWAWVARAARKGDEPFSYPWAGKFPPRGRSGNYADESAGGILGRIIRDYNDGYAATAPTGSYAASLRGIHDLGGNVSEWINDFYSPTPSSAGTAVLDPLGPRSGEAHVIRGSNWSHAQATELRLAYRDFGNAPRDEVGFRIARYAQ